MTTHYLERINVMIKKIKHITTLANENKRAILRQVMIVSGITFGLVGGVLLARPEGEAPVEGEVVEEETITITTVTQD
jgi:hypothetical protein